MTHRFFKFAIGIAACAAVFAHAQIRPAYVYPQASTGGTQLGESPVFFSPWMGLAVGYDDNIFLSTNNARSSGIYVASPGFRLDARSPSSVLQLTHQHQVGRYWKSHEDDYIDHVTHAQGDWVMASRAFGRVGLDYIKGHDPRGSTDRPLSGRPDEYKVLAPNATFAYGAPGAQGRVELYYSYADKRYQNNRATTRVSDRDTQEIGGALYVRVAPRTYVLGEVRQTDIDYMLTSPFSARERRFFGGVSWEATALTTGTLKVGRLKREFDSTLPDVTATSWEGQITWAPRTYSTFDLMTARTTNESTGLGNFILTEVVQLSWNHQWTSYVMTGVAARWQRDEYQGFNRTDDTKSLGLKVGYKFRRWLVLGGEYTYTTRDSNLNFDYNKNVYLLTATITP